MTQQRAVVQMSDKAKNLPDLLDDLRKALSKLVRIAAAQNRSSKSYALSEETIHHVIRQIDNLRRQKEYIINVPIEDDYTVRVMQTIVPKLPKLIDEKRQALTDEAIEQFIKVLMPADPLKDVLLDIENENVELRKRFVKEQRCFDSKTVNRNAGFSTTNEAQTASRWKSKNSIFSIDYFGKELFPAFQFESGKPLPVIKKVLDIFGKHLSPWQIAFWFVVENSWLDEMRPVDVLKEENELLEAAGREIQRAYY